MTCLGCRQLSGAESSPGVALCCILPLQGGCLPLCNVLLLDPGRGKERVTWNLGLQRILFGSACQKSSPGMLMQLQGVMDGGKAGAEGRWRVQVK